MLAAVVSGVTVWLPPTAHAEWPLVDASDTSTNWSWTMPAWMAADKLAIESRPEQLSSDSAKKTPYQMPITGPLYLVSQIQAVEAKGAAPEGKLVSDAGLAWKLPIATGTELQLGCGSEITYPGLQRPVRGTVDRFPIPFQAQPLQLEVQCRCPLVGPLGLECQGKACPALTPFERDQLSQDLRLVCPLGKTGQLQLGAKRTWELSPDAKSATDATQLYGGFRFGW
jgi:hypothetical protein